MKRPSDNNDLSAHFVRLNGKTYVNGLELGFSEASKYEQLSPYERQWLKIDTLREADEMGININSASAKDSPDDPPNWMHELDRRSDDVGAPREDRKLPHTGDYLEFEDTYIIE